MKTLFFIASALIFFVGTITQSFSECRTFTATAQAESLLEARSRAKTSRNLRAIRVYGRKRMCGYARHTELCNRYLKRNVTCRIGTRNRVEPVHICVATGTVCSVERRSRDLLDGPEGFLGPFVPLFQKKKRFKRKRYRGKQYQR